MDWYSELSFDSSKHITIKDVNLKMSQNTTQLETLKKNSNLEVYKSRIAICWPEPV